MKVLFGLYIIGIICGIVGNLIIRLEVASYVKEKRKQGLINKPDWQVWLAGQLKTIVQILLPIYPYFILIGALCTPREKLISNIDNQIAGKAN